MESNPVFDPPPSSAKVVPLRPREQQRQPKKPSGELTVEQILTASTPAEGRLRLKCKVESGFFALITSKDARSYYVEARVRGGKQRKVRLGGVRQQDDKYITMPQARSMARALKAQAHGMNQDGKGIDISRASTKQEGLTLAEAYANFKADKTSPKRTRPWADRTVEHYERMMRFLDGWRSRDLFSISKQDVAARFITIRDKAGEVDARNIFSQFRALWNYHAADREPVPLSPTTVLGRNQKDLWPDIKNKSTIIEEKAFPGWWRSLDDITNPTWAFYYRMMVLMGLRRGELLRAEWSWYDAGKRELTLPDTVNVTKARRVKKLPVGPRLAAMLEKHRRTQADGVLFLFADAAGRRLKKSDTPLRVLRMKHPLPWSAHDLRRTYATVAHDIGVPFKTISMLMNHSAKTKGADADGAEVTFTYIHPEKLKLHQERIEAAIFKRAKLR